VLSEKSGSALNADRVHYFSDYAKAVLADVQTLIALSNTA